MAEKPGVSSGENAALSPGEVAKRREDIHALQEELSRARRTISQLREQLEAAHREARDAAAAKSAVARLSEELQRRELTMERQREVAREFQRRFLPPELPKCDRIRFAVEYLPCERVGGDFYDVFDMGNDCIGILVADVSGFGLGATMLTAMAKICFDTFRQNEYSPKVILEKTNAQIAKATLGNQFITAFLGVLDIETLRLKYVNACQPSPVLCGEDRFELLDTDGLCCGIFHDPKYEEREVQLKTGDRILLYTRGLVTTASGGGKPYEHERLHEFIRGHRDTPIQEIVERVGDDFRRHIAGQEQGDDVILIALEALARATAEDHIAIPSDPQQIRRVESAILPRLEGLNYGERALFGVRLALEEAVVNAIKHGNRMDKAKRVKVAYSVDAKECRISIEDEGAGFDPAAVPDPTAEENLELPHGRGLALIRAYMDEVHYNEKGNRITMVKKVPWAT